MKKTGLPGQIHHLRNNLLFPLWLTLWYVSKKKLLLPFFSDSMGNSRSLIEFSSAQILTATEGFSSSRILGEGGQGCVYRGTLLGSEHAIKKFSGASLKSMSREIKVLSRARHKNIVALVGICVEENCIVSEFVNGGSLKRRMKDKANPLKWNQRKQVIEEIVQALRFLHGIGIVHFNLKPDNLLLELDSLKVKAAGMGISRIFEGNTEFERGQTVTEKLFTIG